VLYKRSSHIVIKIRMRRIPTFITGMTGVSAATTYGGAGDDRGEWTGRSNNVVLLTTRWVVGWNVYAAFVRMWRRALVWRFKFHSQWMGVPIRALPRAPRYSV